MALVAPARLPARAQAMPRVTAPAAQPAPDPVLALRDRAVDAETFRAAIRATVRHHPATAESVALEDEAKYGVAGARQQQLPRIDLSLSSYRVIARDFSNDPFNVIERSRPRHRTDGLISVQQTIFDFGATSRQIRGALARFKGAKADAENSASQVAVSAIAA